MTIITTLNIGLRTNIGTDLVAADVVEYIVARLSQFEHRANVVSVAWRIEEAKYEHDGEQVTERTLVLQVTQRAVTSDAIFPTSPEVYLWAARLHQDCIAVRWHDNETGGAHAELVGPKSEEWGEFNEEFFHNF